eukprot:1005478_1
MRCVIIHHMYILKQKKKKKKKTFRICLRGKHNHISDRIRKHGSWVDCDILPVIYDNLLKFLNNSNQKKYFLDIGGNIGTCSFIMAMHYHYLSIFAFEPVASNRFYFKNTMMTNNFHNIKLIECAGGSDIGHRTIYSFDTNMGDSRIAINGSKLGYKRRSHHSETICLTTIDTVMENEDGIIPLIKMDVQGFEYFALKGAQNLFTNSKFSPLVIKTEFAPWLIRNTNATSTDMLNLMDKYGYDIYKTYNATNNECIQCPFQGLIHPSSFQEFAESIGDGKWTDIYALKKVLY